jgi:hypothetical protein
MAQDKAKKNRRSTAVPTFIRNQMPYGPPIWDAIDRGEVKEMRVTAQAARKWLDQTDVKAKEVKAALKELEKALRNLEK